MSCVFLNLYTVPEGEAGHNIAQFGNFRRSRYGDDTFEEATPPRTQVQEEKVIQFGTITK